MLSMAEKVFLCLVVVLFVSPVGQGSTRMKTDVSHYAATLEVDIAKKSITGSVKIRFQLGRGLSTVEFNCGNLTIESVNENGTPLQFSVHDRKLRVSLGKGKREREIEVKFHGTPRYGIRFFPDRQQVYTIFSPSP